MEKKTIEERDYLKVLIQVHQTFDTSRKGYSSFSFDTIL